MKDPVFVDQLPGLYAARRESLRAERWALRMFCEHPCDRASVRSAMGHMRKKIGERIDAILRALETPPTPVLVKKRRAPAQQHAPDCECPKHAGKSVKAPRVEWDGDKSTCGRFAIQKERPLHEGTIRYLLVKPPGARDGWANASTHRGYRACADKLRGDDTLRGAKHDAQVLADWEHENPQPDSKRTT
jgi:hypothetical protein